MVIVTPVGQLGNRYGKADLKRLGIFSECEYLSKNQPYDDKRNKSLEYRTEGKQFITAPRRKDALFDKGYHRLFENEPQVVNGKEEKKFISDQPFRPANVSTKPGKSKGGKWGTLEEQFPLESNLDVIEPKAVKVVEKKREKKNFITSPGKKGTGQGYADIGFSKIKYQPDSYDNFIIAARKERRDGKKLEISKKAFIGTSSEKDFFNSFTRLPLQSVEEPKKIVKLVPFRPAFSFGYCINKYPSYEPGKGEESVLKPVKPKFGVFKPSGVPCTYPIRSMIESNIPIAPPVWLRDSIKNAAKM